MADPVLSFVVLRTLKEPSVKMMKSFGFLCPNWSFSAYRIALFS